MTNWHLGHGGPAFRCASEVPGAIEYGTVQRAQIWLGTLVQIHVALPVRPAAFALREGDGTGEGESDGDGDGYFRDCRARAIARPHGAIDAAFAAIARVHRRMSPQEPHSDLAHIHEAAPGTIIQCDPWTIAVLRASFALTVDSGGLFNVVRTDDDMNNPSTTQRVLCDRAATALRCIAASQVFKQAQCKVNLGGIAKGFAVDRAVATLRSHGIDHALVNAGGDLRAIGRYAWPVWAGRGLLVRSAAVATSAYQQGVTTGHGDVLWDPQRQQRAVRTATVSVIAPRCMLADALTKVVALSGEANHFAVRRHRAYAWMH